MGVYPVQTAFMRLIGEQADVFPGAVAAPTEYMGATARPVIKAAEEVMRLPAARTVTMYMKGFHDCTDWYLTDPGESVNTYDYQRTRFVEWDSVLYDRENNDKATGAGTGVPLLKADSASWDRVAVTAPVERPVTVVVRWDVLPYSDLNPDWVGGEGPPSTSGGASGQIVWASVAGPDKGVFGAGPLGLSLVGLAGDIQTGGWPTGGHASLVVPPGSTYEVALNFVGAINPAYLNGVGRESQPIRTRLLGGFESIGVLAGIEPNIPPAYFQGFSTVPEVGPTKFVNDSFSMMTVTTY